MFLFKIFAGMLSTLAIVIGTTFAIPESRNFILNTLAPFSQVYEEQQSINEELESANSLSLDTIVEAQEALAVAEQESDSLQTQLDNALSELATERTNLETTQTQLALAETNLENANNSISQLNSELATLNQQYILLNEQLNIALSTDNQAEIDSLNFQIESMSSEIESLNLQISDYSMQISDYDMSIMTYQMEVESLNESISLKDSEITNLQSQIDALAQEISTMQMEIDSLNQQILQLTENSTYTITQQETTYFVVAGESYIPLAETYIWQASQLKTLNNYVSQIKKQNNLLLTIVGGDGATYSMTIEHEFLSGNENYFNRSDLDYAVSSTITFMDANGSVDISQYDDTDNIRISNVEIANITTYEKTSELISNVGGLNYNGNILQSVDIIVYVELA